MVDLYRTRPYTHPYFYQIITIFPSKVLRSCFNRLGNLRSFVPRDLHSVNEFRESDFTYLIFRRVQGISEFLSGYNFEFEIQNVRTRLVVYHLLRGAPEKKIVLMLS